MPNAKQMGHLFQQTGEGASSRKGIAKFFHTGGLRLPLRQSGTFNVNETDPEFEAKTLFSLCTIKSTFQDIPPPLDEEEASKKLNLKTKLPSGYYVLTPGEPPTIAVAYLPRLDSGHDSRAQWNQAIQSPEIASKLSSSIMVTHAIFNLDNFVKARDPFSDYMTIGQGLEPSQRKVMRANTKNLALEHLGISMWTDLPNGVNAFGYPAVVRLSGATQGLEPSNPLEARALLVSDGSIVSTTSQLLGLPIYNHDGCSEINNPRDIQDVKDRAGARAEIIDSMTDLMMAHASILKGTHDVAHSFDTAAKNPQELQQLRETAALNSLKNFGKERQLFIGQSKSAIHQSLDNESECLVVSMDMALVDGQHSSRDYALIAIGCQEPLQSTGPQYWNEPVVDCSPKQISQRAFERAKERWIQKDGLSDLERDPLNLGFAEIQKLRNEHNEKAAVELEEQAQLKILNSFKQFAPTIPVQVNIRAISDPDMALMYVRIENTTAIQSLEAQSIAHKYNEVQSIIADYNLGAALAGDPTRLTATKSLHAHPDYSQVDQPLSLTIPFEEIYPYLKAVSDAQGTRAAKLNAPHLQNYERVRNFAKWEALAILEAEGYIVQNYQDTQFQSLQDRICCLLLSVDALKGRGFEINPTRIGPTLNALTFPAKISTALSEFTKYAIVITQKFLGKLKGFKASPLQHDLSAKETDEQRAKRIYLLCNSALKLKDAMRPEARTAQGVFSKIMSDSTLDNITLTLLSNQYGMDIYERDVLNINKKELRHPAGPQAFEDLASTRTRLQWHAEHSPVPFNQARERLKTLSNELEGDFFHSEEFPSKGPISKAIRQKALESSLLLSRMTDPSERRLIIDATPGPGIALAEINRYSPVPAEPIQRYLEKPVDHPTLSDPKEPPTRTPLKKRAKVTLDSVGAKLKKLETMTPPAINKKKFRSGSTHKVVDSKTSTTKNKGGVPE